MPDVDVSDGGVDVARRGPGDEVRHGGNHGALHVLLDLTGADLADGDEFGVSEAMF